jgi:hypothetical protein
MGRGRGLSARSARRGRRRSGCGEGDGADGRGPRVSEGAHERAGGSALVRWPHQTERKGGREGTQARGFGADRRDPPGREKTRLAGPNGPKG